MCKADSDLFLTKPGMDDLENRIGKTRTIPETHFFQGLRLYLIFVAAPSPPERNKGGDNLPLPQFHAPRRESDGIT